MATMKVFIPTDYTPTVTSVELKNSDSSVSVTLSANGDGWWLNNVADTATYVDNFNVYINGSIVPDDEALDIFYGNKSIKTHITNTILHVTSDDKDSWNTHVASASNPHIVTIEQIEDASSTTIATIDNNAGSGDDTVCWSADKLYTDEIGSRVWNSNALACGITTGDNITDAVNALAGTVLQLDTTVSANSATIKTIVANEYTVKTVSVEGGSTSILITCANVSNWHTLKFYTTGNATLSGHLTLYIDDSLKSTVPIQTTSYNDVVGTYDISDITGNIKIELKVEDLTSAEAQTINAKLSSVVLES